MGKAVVQLGDNADPEACLLDAPRFVVGDFSQVSSVVSTQASQWYEVDTDQMMDIISPDNILVSGKLASGGVASVHIASNPFAGSGYRMEIYGREGTLIALSGESSNHDRVRLQGAQGSDQLEDLPIPPQYTFVLEGMPHGAAYNVGRCTTSSAAASARAKGVSRTSTRPSGCTGSSTLSRRASDQSREVAVR